MELIASIPVPFATGDPTNPNPVWAVVIFTTDDDGVDTYVGMTFGTTAAEAQERATNTIDLYGGSL